MLSIAVGLGAAVAAGSIELPPGWGIAAAQILAWFVLAFAFYACAFAMAGALASRQEDMQNTVTPITYVLFAVFALGFLAAGDPDGALATVASFVPASAPLVMPIRTAAGAAPIWQVALSVGLTLAATAAVVAAAARVYGGAALRTRGQLKLSEAWRAAR